jgi:RNA polymerase sigma-70 factor, ECF subfamily
MRSASAPAASSVAPHHTTQAQEDATAAMLVYLRRRDAGERVDPGAFIVEHASCTEELRQALGWLERIQALRPPSTEE